MLKAQGRFGGGYEGAHRTNSESSEHAYPIRVLRYTLRRGSGGTGKFRGGDGIVRELRFLVPCQITVLSERRKYQPYGLAGGEPGHSGRNVIVRRGGQTEELPSKFTSRVDAGDIVSIQTPGGGGWG